MRRHLLAAPLAGLVIVAVAAGGCTNSDPIGATPGQLTLVVASDGSGAGHYEQLNLAVRQIELRATAAGADNSLGTDEIAGLNGQTLVLNLATTTSYTDGIPLQAGRYEVVRVLFAYADAPRPLLKDDNPATPPPAPAVQCREDVPCVDYVVALPQNEGTLPTSNLRQSVTGATLEITSSDFLSPAVVDIPDGGGVVLTLRLNSVGLAQLFEDAFECRCPGEPACGTGFPAPCLSRFVSPSGGDLAPFVEFE